MKAEMKTCLMLILVVLGFGMTSCVNSEDNPVQPVQPVTPTDPVAQWLSAIPGVSDVEIKVRRAKIPKPENVYYFSFDQLIDHKNPAKGSFKQRVALTYRGIDRSNILITEGYNLNVNPDSIFVCGFDPNNEANLINVEYRYFGQSLPEAFDNFDFTYLNSEQASDDLHAVVSALQQSGRFPHKWISTGVSKSGIATALYAYYSDKKGYDDIALYVPFCAPFCESVEDPRPGKYIETSSLSHAPEVKAKLEAFAKAIYTNVKLRDYLVAAFLSAQNPNSVIDPSAVGNIPEQSYWSLVHFCIAENQHMLVYKLAYLPISVWRDFIPNPAAETEEELSYAYKYIRMDDEALSKYISDLEKQLGKAGTRIKLSDEDYDKLLSVRQTNAWFPSYVQSLRELGSFKLTFDFLDGTPGFDAKLVAEYERVAHYDYSFPMYAGQFNNAMTLDFINNFLPNTKKKMVFVYGGQDHWTGAAIPDPTNPNVKKFIVPGGTHCDDLYKPLYCPAETCEAIIRQMSEFLK